MSKYEISINKDRCVGSTLCMMEAPDIFALDKEHQAHVLEPDTPDDEGVLGAARSCPMNAIFLIDKETGERVWPRA
ncbi:MAG: ferredoxin [Calditrichaeota bacterium]|nr:ferredoxin [Calditrichota bacterium]